MRSKPRTNLLQAAEIIHHRLTHAGCVVLPVRAKTIRRRIIQAHQMTQAGLSVKVLGSHVRVILLADGGGELTVRNIGVLRVLLSDIVKNAHCPIPRPRGSCWLRLICAAGAPDAPPANFWNVFAAFGVTTWIEREP